MECSPEEARKKLCPIIKDKDKCESTNCMSWHRQGTLSGYCDLIRKR